MTGTKVYCICGYLCKKNGWQWNRKRIFFHHRRCKEKVTEDLKISSQFADQLSMRNNRREISKSYLSFYYLRSFCTLNLPCVDISDVVKTFPINIVGSSIVDSGIGHGQRRVFWGHFISMRYLSTKLVIE